MSKEVYYLNIPPSTGEIQAMIDADMSLKKAVAELIANSLDQDATNIELKLDKKKGIFIIKDNGNGCANLEKMIQIGMHIKTKNGSIGRYGVGFKDAVIWLGDFVVIDSQTRSGKKQSATADWQNMMAIHEWLVQFQHDSDRASHGVTITVTGLRGRRFKQWQEVANYIAELFSAAIDAGIEITVDGKALASIPQPLLEHAAEFHGTFGGLAFRGIAGVLVDRKAAPSGWELRYPPQTIQIGYMKEGFGTYSAQDFYGRFYMVDDQRKWKLTRNKTDSEDLYDVLNCEYLQSVIRPILDFIKEREESMTMRCNQLKAETCLTNLLQRAKVRISEEEEEECGGNGGGGVGGGRGGKRGTGKTRKKRIYDPLSDTKEKIKQAQRVQIFRHKDIKNHGFSYISVVEHGTIIKIYIDDSTEAGKAVWLLPALVIHHAVMCLAVHFGLQTNILGQLRLPIGELGNSRDEKISQCLAYLFSHVDLDGFEAVTVAA